MFRRIVPMQLFCFVLFVAFMVTSDRLVAFTHEYQTALMLVTWVAVLFFGLWLYWDIQDGEDWKNRPAKYRRIVELGVVSVVFLVGLRVAMVYVNKQMFVPYFFTIAATWMTSRIVAWHGGAMVYKKLVQQEVQGKYQEFLRANTFGR